MLSVARRKTYQTNLTGVLNNTSSAVTNTFNCGLTSATVTCIHAAYQVKLHPENTTYIASLERKLGLWQQSIHKNLVNHTSKKALLTVMNRWLYLQLNYNSKNVIQRLKPTSIADYIEYVSTLSKFLVSIDSDGHCLTCLYLLVLQPIPNTTHKSAHQLSCVKHAIYQLLTSKKGPCNYYTISEKLFCQTEPSFCLSGHYSLGCAFITGMAFALSCLQAISLYPHSCYF
ncbi:MAG: hypothetical protein VXZ73_02825 [Pseudomonadota bacterium]|nr:hypothetical protein [Pseudomonadota bacterium]